MQQNNPTTAAAGAGTTGLNGDHEQLVAHGGMAIRADEPQVLELAVLRHA